MIVRKSKLFTACASVLALALSATFAWSADTTDTSADAKKAADAKKTADAKKKKDASKYAKGPAGATPAPAPQPYGKKVNEYWWQRLNEASPSKARQPMFRSAQALEILRRRCAASAPPPFDGPPFPIRIGNSAAVRMSSAIRAPCGTAPSR
jgi:hypothetical protein